MLANRQCGRACNQVFNGDAQSEADANGYSQVRREHAVGGRCDDPSIDSNGTVGHPNPTIIACGDLDNAHRPGFFFGKLGQQRVVNTDHTNLCALEDLGFGRDDALLGSKPLQMNRADRHNRRHPRRNPPAQLRDLTGTVGTHLGDEHLRTGSKALVDRSCQPHSVVEGSGASHCSFRPVE